MDKFLVGTMVRNLRECMGLTQKELGERIKVSRITINNWEHTGTELENYLKLVEVLFPGKPKVQAKPKVTKLVPISAVWRRARPRSPSSFWLLLSGLLRNPGPRGPKKREKKGRKKGGAKAPPFCL